MGSVTIPIEQLSFHLRVNAVDGSSAPVIHGSTSKKFHALGAEGAYAIFDVEISDAHAVGKGTISKTYASDGHSMRSKLELGLSKEAIISLVNEARAAGSRRRLDITDTTLTAFTSPSITESNTIFLAYWKDRTVVSIKDEVIVRWPFEFARATMCSQHFHHMRPIVDEPPQLGVSGNVSVQVDSQHHVLVKPLTDLVERVDTALGHIRLVAFTLLALAVFLVIRALLR